MIKVTIGIQKLADDLNLSPMKGHEMVETISRQIPGFRKKNIERVGFFDADDKNLKRKLYKLNKDGKNKAHYNPQTKRLEVRHCNEYNIDTQRIPKLLKPNAFIIHKKEQRQLQKIYKCAETITVASAPIARGQILFEEMLNNRKQLRRFGIISPSKATLNKKGVYSKFKMNEYQGIIKRILLHPSLKEKFINKFGGYILECKSKVWGATGNPG